MIQGPRGQGSASEEHQTEGVLVVSREALAGIPELRGTAESRDYSEC